MAKLLLTFNFQILRGHLRDHTGSPPGHWGEGNTTLPSASSLPWAEPFIGLEIVEGPGPEYSVHYPWGRGLPHWLRHLNGAYAVVTVIGIGLGKVCFGENPLGT
jgi:hypothetical protein